MNNRSSSKRESTIKVPQKTDLFEKVIAGNNRRVIKSFLSIFILANIATAAIKASGKGSQYLTWTNLLIEIGVISVILLVTTLLIRDKKGNITGYITITGVTLALWFFQFFIYGATELFAVHYIILALSVFYFNKKLSVYTLALILLSQTSLFILIPSLIPAGASSNMMIRYLVYLWVAIGTYFGAISTKALFNIAFDNQKNSERSLGRIMNIITSITESVGVMKDETFKQAEISGKLNDISRHQAAALEEISSSLEELAANSESINNTAGTLLAETDSIINSVNDLKKQAAQWSGAPTI